MKKSLSVLVAGAMVSSMFASLAFADDAADKTTEEKLKELIEAGIFDPEGTGNGFELDSNMTREQLAKILAKLKKLEELSTSQIYEDVETDRWSAGFIAAVSKAQPPLMDGVADGVFDPEGYVTLEQLATVMVRALNLQVKDGDVDGEVSDWAKGYVATALANGLIAEKSDYTEYAIRAELVESTYAAREALAELEKPAKVSIKEAKAVGVQKVQVTLDRDVDTSKATFTLKKGGVDIALDTAATQWSDDKKTATLKLKDVKISEGTYTVTIGGLDASEIDKASVQFNAENEKVTKLEFVNPSDTLALTDKAIVKIKASNQYGENASFSAGSYTVIAGNNNDVYVKLTKSDNGELLLTLKTNIENSNGDLIYTPGLSIIPVNIYHNDTRVTASKNFKLGTAPFISKMELGDAKYSNGKDYLGGTGEAVTFDVINYDQYGNIVPHNPVDADNIRVIFNAYEPKLTWQAGDSNNDDITDVKISLSQNVDKSGEYTFTVYNQGGSASGKVSVKSAKVATKIELGDPTDVIAAGDEAAYIPLIAYDADGQQLSVDDLVSDENVARINVSSSTGSNHAVLITAGEHKGKIKITNIPDTPRNIISVTAYIATPNTNSIANKTYTVSDVRVPDRIAVVTDPAKKIVAEAESKFKFVVYDQYGKEMKNPKYVNTNNGRVESAPGAGIAEYRVTVTASTYDNSIVAFNTKTNSNFSTDPSTPDIYDGQDIGNIFNQEHKFVTGASINGHADITAVLEKRVGSGNWTEISKVYRKIEAVKATDELTYSVNAVSPLYNAVDNDNWTVRDSVYDSGNQQLSKADQTNPLTSKFAREVTVKAVDAAGNTVALPKKIKQITSSNPLVAIAATDGNGKAFVIGNKKGTATLNVAFETHKGDTVVKSITVETKDDIITSTKVVAGNTTRTMAQAQATPNAFELMNVKVTDNYGITYEGAVAKKYNYLFGVVFSVKNVKGGSVKVDQYGNLTIDPGVQSFELVATSGAGFSASTTVGP